MTAGFTATASQRYGHPIEKVFAAWTTPAALERWYAPATGWVATVVEFDPRTGGGYRIEFGPASEPARYTEIGEYTAFESPRLLAIRIEVRGGGAEATRTDAEVRFTSVDGGTEVTVTDTGYPRAAVADEHSEGWQQSLDKLLDVLAAERDTTP